MWKFIWRRSDVRIVDFEHIPYNILYIGPFHATAQLANICSKLTIETLEQVVKYIQS